MRCHGGGTRGNLRFRGCGICRRRSSHTWAGEWSSIVAHPYTRTMRAARGWGRPGRVDSARAQYNGRRTPDWTLGPGWCHCYPTNRDPTCNVVKQRKSALPCANALPSRLGWLLRWCSVAAGAEAGAGHRPVLRRRPPRSRSLPALRSRPSRKPKLRLLRR